MSPQTRCDTPDVAALLPHSGIQVRLDLQQVQRAVVLHMVMWQEEILPLGCLTICHGTALGVLEHCISSRGSGGREKFWC